MSVGTAGLAAAEGALAERFDAVRATSEALCTSLATEDFVVQSMPDASPTKWHLAHTSWYFETFVLAELGGYTSPDPAYAVLFNSYYNAVGPQHPRPRRGLLTRPTVDEVFAYRAHVDAAMRELLAADASHWAPCADRIELGLQHEQQHQELMLTDLKHAFAQNPLRPAFRPAAARAHQAASPLRWTAFEEQVRWIGHDGKGFCFDNEQPCHRRIVPAFALATRPVTCGEFLAFVDAGGYRRPELWLADGWAVVQESGWRAPLYWEERDGEWWQMTLGGMRPVDPAEPVCHVSFYEADAFASFAGARLPTEQEWEAAAQTVEVGGNLLEQQRWHPAAEGPDVRGLRQLYGDVWEWTRSAYEPYPGYAPPPGAVGEYNGKFMCNQLVLRGGSCATPASHIRASYRNFFPPEARWQFSGFRLARDA